jgi:hypothetical protein
MPTGSFNGLSVLALESRRAREIAKLIENLGGVPIVAPSVREVPLDSNQEALEFARNFESWPGGHGDFHHRSRSEGPCFCR